MRTIQQIISYWESEQKRLDTLSVNKAITVMESIAFKGAAVCITGVLKDLIYIKSVYELRKPIRGN